MLKYVLIAAAAVSIIYLVYAFLPKRRPGSEKKTYTGDDAAPYYSDSSPSYGGKGCKGSTADDSSYGDCGSSDGGSGDGGGD